MVELKYDFLFYTKWRGKKKWNRSCDNFSRKRQKKSLERGFLIWCLRSRLSGHFSPTSPLSHLCL